MTGRYRSAVVKSNKGFVFQSDLFGLEMWQNAEVLKLLEAENAYTNYQVFALDSFHNREPFFISLYGRHIIFVPRVRASTKKFFLMSKRPISRCHISGQLSSLLSHLSLADCLANSVLSEARTSTSRKLSRAAHTSGWRFTSSFPAA